MEQFLLLLLFVAFALGNYLLRWLRSRQEPPATEEQGRERVTFPPGAQPRPPEEAHTTEPFPPRRRARPPEDAETTEPVAFPSRWRSRPRADAEDRARPHSPPPMAPARRARRAYFDRPLDLRQAIVLMAVLGPCRGEEPEETSHRP